MAFASAIISVGTTATQLTGVGDGGSRPLQSAAVKNIDPAATVWLGPSTVVAASTAGAVNGYPLGPGESVAVDAVVGTDDLYGRTASGAVLVAVLGSGA